MHSACVKLIGQSQVFVGLHLVLCLRRFCSSSLVYARLSGLGSPGILLALAPLSPEESWADLAPHAF